MGADVASFIARYENSSASEQQTKVSFINDLCDLLGVPRPEPGSGTPEKDRYVYEHRVRARDASGKEHTNWIDLYKEGHFVLEAKQGANEGAKKAGHGLRETNAWNIKLNEAFGQALAYAKALPNPVPILVVCDIGYCFDIYESFDGSGAYRAFPTAQTKRLYLRDLAQHLDTLRRIWTDPLSLDPSRKAAKVTQEVAAHLAELAKKLEDKGHSQEEVARFLMRCLFTMFAEDIELLPEHLFTRFLHDFWIPHPNTFRHGVASVWEAMNTGGNTMLGPVRHFNGGLFRDTRALDLDEEALKELHKAATHDWSDVEPAIFGTLLERALDKKERHRLGAHYTPRAYVERLVRPTIEEPIRAEWDDVQAQVAALRAQEEKTDSKATKKKKRTEAIKLVRGFHRRLCEIRVLDPACGSGNFLYVALHLFQQIESEVWALLESLGESQDVLRLETLRVTPAQFLGIEKKKWAKEIAELVLWIGYLQWHYRMLGKKPPEFTPVLHDYKNIEARDAILSYDAEEPVRDESGKPISRWDGETMKIHPVTKKEVPDESARVLVYQYVNPRQAEWPKADFVVGNPPFVGNKRMRLALGDGYVDALRSAFPEVPDTADYVMYWWNDAAMALRSETTRRFGLIATNSITQPFNRKIVASILEGTPRLSLLFAIPDHPWMDSSSGAAVRISMTVAELGEAPGTLLRVTSETGDRDGFSNVTLEAHVGQILPDLSVGPNVGGMRPLLANSGIAFQGVIPLGDGFRLNRAELTELGYSPDNLPPVIRPFVIGRDIVQRREDRWVIDFHGLDEEEAQKAYPALFQRVLTLVKPERDQNRRDTRRRNWWLFGENAPKMRRATGSLAQFIGTPDTSKFKPFTFLPKGVLPDVQVYAVASDDAFLLGVLSSRVHQSWLKRAAPRMGVGNDLRWKPSVVFAPFPFPTCSDTAKARIRKSAEQIDGHRKDRQHTEPLLTLTEVYNVLEKLRSGEPLTDKEQVIHEKGLVSILKKLHDDLDAAVFEAYGWPPDLTDEQILEKLVALNAERAEEEKRGLVRWLRPDFQNPTGTQAATQTTIAEAEISETSEEAEPSPAAAKAWPKKLPEQLAAVRELLGGSASLWTAREVAATFTGAKPDDVAPILESLASLGFLLAFPGADEPRWKSPRPS